jgi:hypothetical protein
VVKRRSEFCLDRGWRGYLRRGKRAGNLFVMFEYMFDPHGVKHPPSTSSRKLKNKKKNALRSPPSSA